MIFGDPYKFAILIQYMPFWNTDHVHWDNKRSNGNGILQYIIDGHIFPNEIVTSLLGTDLNYLITKSILNPETNLSYYHMTKQKAFEEMLFLAKPLCIDPHFNNDDYIEDESYYIETLTATTEFDCHMVYVSDGGHVRILGSQLQFREVETEYKYYQERLPSEVYEAILSLEEYREIINQLIQYYEKNSGREFNLI